VCNQHISFHVHPLLLQEGWIRSVCKWPNVCGTLLKHCISSVASGSDVICAYSSSESPNIVLGSIKENVGFISLELQIVQVIY